MDKERREKLRCACAAWESERPHDPVAHISTYELRTLLDMADERDRYRALLEAYSSGAFGTHEWFMKQVDAELESNHD